MRAVAVHYIMKPGSYEYYLLLILFVCLFVCWTKITIVGVPEFCFNSEVDLKI